MTAAPGYSLNRGWSDGWNDAIRRVVGPRLLVVADVDDDVSRATDMLSFIATPRRIACRVRRLQEYTDDRAREFTIRSWVPRGLDTEWHKVLSGCGDWLFYGWEAADGGLGPWWLLDLHVFRACHEPFTVNGVRSWSPRLEVAPHQYDNNDGTKFLAYTVSKFPAAFVVDAQPP